mgnify:CR=1 FL=1
MLRETRSLIELVDVFFIERVAELENTVKVYERQMNEQEEEANTVIEKWQETCTDLEAKNSELLQLLNATEASTTSVDSAKMSPLQEELNDIKAQLEEAKKIGSEDKRALLEWECKYFDRSACCCTTIVDMSISQSIAISTL